MSETNRQNNQAETNKSAQLEALLFWFAEPVTKKKIAELLSISKEELDKIVNELKQSQSERNSGLILIDNGNELTLATAAASADLISKISKEELSRDLGKAALDTLSIILYEGPVSRADIDYIRGVSSQYIVRNLQIRGLIYRLENPEDERKILYAPTIELLTHLGVSSVKDLPDYDKVREEIKSIREAKNNVVL